MEAHVLELEEKRLASVLRGYSGQTLLQLGNDRYLFNVTASPIAHKICLTPYSTKANTYKVLGHCAQLKSNYTNLPFASETINLILVPHTFESEGNAKPILSEAWRVLTPNGHLVLLGVNPISLWGLYRLLFKISPVWDGCFYSIPTLSKWIYYLGGEIHHKESFLFRPPLFSKIGCWLFNKLLWIEHISPWLAPYMGGIYLIIAKKRVKRLNEIGVAWRFPLALNTKVFAPNARGFHH